METCLYCHRVVHIPSMQLCSMHYQRWQERRPMDLPPRVSSKPRKRWINRNGYIVISIPATIEEPRRKSVLEHRYVMEQYLERKLDPKEIVHHINEIKTDNRIENLELVTNQTHPKKHPRNYSKCPLCGATHWSKNDPKT